MSTNTKESGSIQFTAKGYASLLSAMRNAYNERQDFFYEIAMNLYNLCVSDKKKYTKEALRHGVNGNNAFIDLGDYGKKISYAGCPTHHVYFAESETICFILNEIFRNDKGTPLKPRKSHFVKFTNKDHSINIETNSGNITLTKDHKKLYWFVEENNNSVTSARNDCMSKVMFKVLKDHAWARGEGGAFYYSDEYDRKPTISSKFGNQA